MTSPKAVQATPRSLKSPEQHEDIRTILNAPSIRCDDRSRIWVLFQNHAVESISSCSIWRVVAWHPTGRRILTAKRIDRENIGESAGQDGQNKKLDLAIMQMTMDRCLKKTVYADDDSNLRLKVVEIRKLLMRH